MEIAILVVQMKCLLEMVQVAFKFKGVKEIHTLIWMSEDALTVHHTKFKLLMEEVADQIANQTNILMETVYANIVNQVQ